MNRNLRITISGVSHSGKTTLARHLATFLKLTGWNVEFDTNVATEAGEPAREFEADCVAAVRNRALVVVREENVNRQAKEDEKSSGPCGGINAYWERNDHSSCPYWSSNKDGCMTCPRYQRRSLV